MFEAILLGLIHGIAAFLPVSALAHRTVIGVLLGFDASNPVLEAALETGSLVACSLLFGWDWLQMAGNAVGLRFGRDPDLHRAPYMLWMLLAASVPLAITGYWMASAATALRNPFLVGLLLIGVGVAMGWAESAARRQKTIDHLAFADAMLIGLVQALAVLPGASRLALTLTTAMLLNFDRTAALRLSYLLGLPVLAGRTWFTVGRLVESGMGEGAAIFAAAAITCAIASAATMAFFTEYLRQRTLRPLVRYRVAFGIIVIALALLFR